MRTLDPAVVEAFESGTAVLVTLVEIAFPSQAIRLNSSNWDLEYEGNTYLGAAGLGRIDPITDQGGELPGMKLELLNVSPAMIAVALDEADEVQGSEVTIRTAILGGDPLAILDAEIDSVGYGDTMSIEEDGQSGSIVMTAESKGVDLLRGNPLLYNDADQRSLYPEDRAFQYVNAQSDQNVIWPTKGWFTK